MTLQRALAEAEACGVSRLADITGLDRLGVHVFQAVRPWSRSLSVHQGKGLSPEVAKISALMEAIEFDCAENFQADKRACALDTIDVSERAPSVLDFAVDRGQPLTASEPLSWVVARTPGGDGRLWVPFESVSGDYTWRGHARLDRTSNGVGAHFDAEAAAMKGLLEVIERDACRAWRTSSLEDRARSQIQAASIPFDWFRDIYAQARAAGVSFSIYAIPTVIALPAFACELFERQAGSALRRRVSGFGCGLSAEAAVLAAVLEAAQTRLTAISGARDDLPDPQEAPRAGFGGALPPPANRRLAVWEEIADGAPSASGATVAGLTEALALSGFPQVGFVDLSRPDRQACVVKAFVPGLGAFSRARRVGAVRVC